MARRNRVTMLATAAVLGLATVAAQGAQAAVSDAAAPPATSDGWASVEAGAGFTCAVRVDGTLWCWGNNGFGQLGDGTTTDRLRPVQVGSATDWGTVNAAESHTCGTRTDGTLWCWGRDNAGQIGDGTRGRSRPTPEQVGSATTWASVSGGSVHTCARQTDNTVWCWGGNQLAQLGDGTQERSLLPEQVGGGTADWMSLTTGLYHACGVRTGGALWCWGGNLQGQLGDGTLNRRSHPVQVGSDTDWGVVNGGAADYTCATRGAGSLWCWGGNDEGQLGDGTRSMRTTPVQVGTNGTWQTVAGGDVHTCATRSNGTLWCWGWNGTGALGDGTHRIHVRPERVGNATTWRSVTAGASQTCAIRVDGTLWCWGSNNFGQVGDGTTKNRLHPVRVLLP